MCRTAGLPRGQEVLERTDNWSFCLLPLIQTFNLNKRVTIRCLMRLCKCTLEPFRILYYNTLVATGIGRVNDKFKSAKAKRGQRLRKSSLEEAEDQFDAFPIKTTVITSEAQTKFRICAFPTTLSSEQEADFNRQFLKTLYRHCVTNQFPFSCVKAGSGDWCQLPLKNR